MQDLLLLLNHVPPEKRAPNTGTEYNAYELIISNLMEKGTPDMLAALFTYCQSDNKYSVLRWLSEHAQRKLLQTAVLETNKRVFAPLIFNELIKSGEQAYKRLIYDGFWAALEHTADSDALRLILELVGTLSLTAREALFLHFDHAVDILRTLFNKKISEYNDDVILTNLRLILDFIHPFSAEGRSDLFLGEYNFLSYIVLTAFSDDSLKKTLDLVLKAISDLPSKRQLTIFLWESPVASINIFDSFPSAYMGDLLTLIKNLDLSDQRILLAKTGTSIIERIATSNEESMTLELIDYITGFKPKVYTAFFSADMLSKAFKYLEPKSLTLFLNLFNTLDQDKKRAMIRQVDVDLNNVLHLVAMHGAQKESMPVIMDYLISIRGDKTLQLFNSPNLHGKKVLECLNDKTAFVLPYFMSLPGLLDSLQPKVLASLLGQTCKNNPLLHATWIAQIRQLTPEKQACIYSIPNTEGDNLLMQILRHHSGAARPLFDAIKALDWRLRKPILHQLNEAGELPLTLAIRAESSLSNKIRAAMKNDKSPRQFFESSSHSSDTDPISQPGLASSPH